LKEFSDDVKKTSDLLDFIISQGYSRHIPDRIIDDIETARQLLKEHPDPPKEERARLMKAYRDLVAVPNTSVTYDGIPPTAFWSVRSRWPWLLLTIDIIPSIVLLILIGVRQEFNEHWHWPLTYALLSGVLIWGIYVFTGVVADSKLNKMIGACYVFTMFALAVAIAPFCVPQFFSSPSLNSPVNVLRGCAMETSPATVPAEVKCADAEANRNDQWVINVGGVVESASPQASPAERHQITGGMVVPLYVLILALFGSAVSMTRRVPEIQERALDPQDALTNVVARQLLVAQIMQVLSAPLIVITVYYVLKPGTPAQSALLGFSSGFASETILRAIQKLADNLNPAPATASSPVSVRVDPTSVTLKPNQTQQFSSQISGLSNSDVTWHIDPSDATGGTISQGGYYVAPAIPLGRAVTITAISAADRTKSGRATVAVQT
jgi:hypothetical protein